MSKHKGKINFETVPQHNGTDLVKTDDSRLSDARTPTSHATTHQNGGSDEVATATAAANAIPKAGAGGTLADGWIAASSVTQHEGSIDHNALTNYDVAQHRIINDAGTSATELWSASKIDSMVSAVARDLDLKDSVETVADTNISLSGEQTLNGILTSTSRVGVVGQSTASENGIYVTAAGAWTRAVDADANSEVTQGMTFFVADGNKKGYQYILTTADPITVGSTALTFNEIPRLELGTTAGTACEGNDSRLSDARTPTAHASSHQNGGSDEIATATAAANAIPKAGAGGTFAAGWIDDTAHGTRGGGTQHAAATTSVNGFMSSGDKTKLDGVETAADVTDATNVNAAGAVMHTDISAASGWLRKTASETYEAVKVNLGASTNPTTTDDSGSGYAVGSRWINTTADKEWVCLDATASAAVWKETTGAGGGSVEVDKQSVTSAFPVSTTSGTFVDITGVTLTTSNTVAKKYDVHFSCTFDNSTTNKTVDFAIVVDGSLDADSTRTIDIKNASAKMVISTHCQTSALATGKIIKVQYRTSGGTLTVDQHAMMISGVS